MVFAADGGAHDASRDQFDLADFFEDLGKRIGHLELMGAGRRGGKRVIGAWWAGGEAASSPWRETWRSVFARFFEGADGFAEFVEFAAEGVDVAVPASGLGRRLAESFGGAGDVFGEVGGHFAQ